MAKNPAKRTQVEKPDALSRSSAELPPDAAAVDAQKPVARSVDEPPYAPDTAERVRFLQLIADTAGRTHHAVTRWLEHERAHIRVLGWITWLFLLGLVGAAFLLVVALFIMVAFRYPLDTLWYVAVGTGATAIGNGIGRLRRR